MFRLLATAAALTLTPAVEAAQDETTLTQTTGTAVEERAEDIIPALRGELAYDEVFALGFRNAIAEAQFLGIKDQLESQFGAIVGLESVESITDSTAQLTIRFERAFATGMLAVQDAEPHQVVGFRITDFQPIDDSPEGLLADLEALPGETSLLITRLNADEPVFAYNSDAQLALGSTFKLYVLSALVQAIGAGELRWDDVVELDRSSYPSGQLQDWPQGAPVTLHTLATLMISISDNTATDQLIAVLGRDAIEAEVAASGHAMPELNVPFMSTRELFVLKSVGEDEIEAYRAMSTDERRDALDALGSVERETDQIMAAFTGGPNAIDIEWFASGEDIARLYTRIIDAGDETALGILGVSPSMAGSNLEAWDYVGFKGGSEPGVLNLSWVLRDEQGDWWTITMGSNNPDADIDQQSFELLSSRAVSLATGE